MKASIRVTEDGIEAQVDDQTIALNNYNYAVHLHSDAPEYDHIGIQDPEDHRWWLYFRDHMPPEAFELSIRVSHYVGQAVLRQHPTPATLKSFALRQNIIRDEIDHFLGDVCDDAGD